MARKRINRDDDGSKAIDSILFKLVSRLVLSLVVIVTVLTLIQCATKRPQPPVEFRGTVTKTYLPVGQKVILDCELTNRHESGTHSLAPTLSFAGTCGHTFNPGSNDFLNSGDRSEISFRLDGEL